MSRAQDTYLLWVAALARSNQELARVHADQLIFLMLQYDEFPSWTEEGKRSFIAWWQGSDRRRGIR